MFELLFLIIIGFLIYFAFLKKPKTEAVKEEEVLVFPKYIFWSLFVAIFSLNIFAYDVGAVGIGLGLFNISILAALFISFDKKKHPKLTYILGLISIFCGMALGYRANGFVMSLNGVVVTLVLVALLFIHGFDKVIWKGLWLIKAIWSYCLQALKNIPSFVKVSNSVGGSKKSIIINVLKTTFITLIVLLFFANVLSSADPVFEKIIQTIKNQAAGRTLASLAFASFLTLGLTTKVKSNEEDITTLKFLSFYDFFVPVLGLVSLFGVFIFVQIKYLFGSHVDFQSFDITYSEYVRKGFIELIITTLVGGIIVYGVILKQKLIDEANKITQLKILNILVIIELAFIMVSALKRDLMYVEIYGLTRTRIIGEFFLAWLGGLLICLLLLNIVKNFKESYAFSIMLFLSIVVTTSLNVINVDAIIVHADAPKDLNGERDYFYINNLSEDAIEGWVQSVYASQKTFASLYNVASPTNSQKIKLANTLLAMTSLRENVKRLEQKFGKESDVINGYYGNNQDYGSNQDYRSNQDYKNSPDDTTKSKELPDWIKNQRKWQAYNDSQKTAYDVINNNHKLFTKTVECLVTEIENYQKYYNVDLYKEENNRVYESSYPFVSIDSGYYPRSLDSIKYDYQYKSKTPMDIPDKQIIYITPKTCEL